MKEVLEFLGTMLAAVLALIGVLITQMFSLYLEIRRWRERRAERVAAYVHEKRTYAYEDVWNILTHDSLEKIESQLPNVAIGPTREIKDKLRSYQRHYPVLYLSPAVLDELREYLDGSSDKPTDETFGRLRQRMAAEIAEEG